VEAVVSDADAVDRVMRQAARAHQSARGFDDGSCGWWPAVAAPGVPVDVSYEARLSPVLARNSLAAIRELAAWALGGLPVEPWEVDALTDDPERLEQMRAAAVELERLAHGLRLTLDGVTEEAQS
jgi:hypothetical protein